VNKITDYPLTTKFNEIDRVHPQKHTGLDLAVPYATEILSQDRAIVSVTHDQWLGTAGRLKLENGDVIVYGHLSRVDVAEGQHIKANQLIGLSGGLPNANQGKSTAPHVHVSQYHEGVLINPYDYLFNHQEVESNSPFLFPVMLILMLFILWKIKKFVVYGFAVAVGLIVIFVVS